MTNDDLAFALDHWRAYARANGLTWSQVEAGYPVIEDCDSLDDLPSWGALAAVVAPITYARGEYRVIV